jgi:hypothetical protein
LTVLKKTKLKLADVEWPRGVIINIGKQSKVGLEDGRVLPITAWKGCIAGNYT